MRYKIIHHFLSDEECDQLIDIASTRLTPSYTWDVATGTSTQTEYRKSEQMFFAIGANDLIKQIEQRIADVTKIPVEYGEGLQMVHYHPGGFYKEHYDYFDPEYAGNKSVIDRGGQRIATVLMYLNFVEAGGSTYFPRVGMDIQPEKGKAIIWFNIDMVTGAVDPSTYHEAKPVVKGEKWAATKWLRERLFR